MVGSCWHFLNNYWCLSIVPGFCGEQWKRKWVRVGSRHCRVSCTVCMSQPQQRRELSIDIMIEDRNSSIYLDRGTDNWNTVLLQSMTVVTFITWCTVELNGNGCNPTIYQTFFHAACLSLLVSAGRHKHDSDYATASSVEIKIKKWSHKQYSLWNIYIRNKMRKSEVDKYRKQ